MTTPVRGNEPGTTFGGLTCVIDDTNGSGQVITFGQADDDRVVWRITGFDGWDSADLPEAAEAKTGADGSWDTDNYYAGRQVTIEGIIAAPSRAALDTAKTHLAQAIPPRGRLVTFRVNETTPKQASVRRTGRLMIGDVTDVLAQFSINLFAPDPRKYGVDVQFAAGSLAGSTTGVTPPLDMPLVLPERGPDGASFTVTNDGTYETPPLIRFAGPGKNLGIVNLTTGLLLQYPFVLAAGQELIVDTEAGAAQLNGTAYRAPSPGSAVTTRFQIPPGTSQMQMIGERTDSDVSPLVGLSWRPAWT